ncbi:MAG: Fic family protein [Pseudonocardiaceae bacterium]
MIRKHRLMRFYCLFVAATLAHLYIAWIHPFGDRNGRTARLLECAILAHSGVVPWVSSNLLSDHYNRTRSRYYQRLERASRERDVRGFITVVLSLPTGSRDNPDVTQRSAGALTEADCALIFCTCRLFRWRRYGHGFPNSWTRSATPRSG